MIKMVKITLKSLIKRQDNTPWKELDKEGILLKLKDGDYFGINEVGLFIWKLLNGNKDLEQIAKRVTLRYKVSKATAFSDTLKFIKTLYKKDLATLCGKNKG